jgi:cell division protein FtsQ
MRTVAAPADRRFRRAQVKPSRRRLHWRTRVRPVLQSIVLAAAAIYGAYRLSAVAAYAHVLRIDRIIVAGNERLSKGEVLAVLNGLQGESILRADLDAWRRRLLASPWVREAALHRSLPSTVEVAVAERQPMAIARIHSEMYLVDAHGIVIDEYGPQYADLDLPIVDGLVTNGPSKTDPFRGELAARVITSLGSKPHVAAMLSQVDVSDLHNAAVMLTGDPAVIHLGEDQFLSRIESYLGVAAALRERVADIESVDLRFEERIYVRPAPALRKTEASRWGRGAAVGKK